MRKPYRPLDTHHYSPVEVVNPVAQKRHWLWWAVDQNGFVVDVPVTSRPDPKPAKRLLRELLK